MSILIVVAHPDDEVLGVGGLVSQVTHNGGLVRCCLAAAGADARSKRPSSSQLYSDLIRANEILGIRDPILGDFPNIRLNTVPHLDLVQFIENAIVETEATQVLTHHPRDLNSDHQILSTACQAAARLSQRRPDVPRITAFHFMEVLSSTEWSVPGTGEPFEPNTFFEIGPEGLERKLEALAAYRGVMRDYPHPRSREVISGLAAYRGAQAGLNYAEAFQTVYRTAGISDFQD